MQSLYSTAPTNWAHLGVFKQWISRYFLWTCEENSILFVFTLQIIFSIFLAQLVGAAEYADYISAEG